ncbi:Signal recognition particle receptor subunit beta [[Candida] zeylanoides]
MDRVQLSLITFVIALAVVLLVTTFRGISGKAARVKSPYAKPTFMILGPNGAGKTALYYRLLANNDDGQGPHKITPTVSSIDPNYGSVKLPFSHQSIAKPFQLIDYPGHLKYSQLLYRLMLDQITLHKIKGIVFVIDSSTAALDQVAKTLFRLFTVTERLTNGIDFLFAVNKSDLFNSRPVHKVKEILEAEITKLVQRELSEKFSSSAGGSGIDAATEIDGSEDADDDTGANSKEFWSSVVSSNRQFRFEMLEGNMDFASGSVLRDKVETWENWFDEKVVNT